MQCDESIRRVVDRTTVTDLSECHRANENSKIGYLPIGKKKSSWRDKLKPWAFVLGFISVVGLLEGLIGR